MVSLCRQEQCVEGTELLLKDGTQSNKSTRGAITVATPHGGHTAAHRAPSAARRGRRGLLARRQRLEPRHALVSAPGRVVARGGAAARRRVAKYGLAPIELIRIDRVVRHAEIACEIALRRRALGRRRATARDQLPKLGHLCLRVGT